MSETYDVAVLGAGSAGYACALRAAQLGLSVALVDEAEVGGTCLHRGCIPTKAWLQAAEVRRTVASASGFGIGAEVGEVDATRLRTYADGVVSSLHRGLKGLLASRGVHTIAERGHLVVDERGPGIELGAKVLRAKAVVLATGAAPSTLGLSVDGSRIITSEHALRLDQLPESAIVLGGGVIGVEFASAWTDLGVRVTLVEAEERLLPAEEPAHSAVLTRALAKRGVDIKLGTPIAGATADDTGVRVRLGDDELQADVLLVAVGRRPRLDDLGLAEASVEINGGHIVVDEHLRTSVPGVFAAGDVVAGPQLAHRGYAHGVFLAEHIAASTGVWPGRPSLPKDHNIARVVYSSPQLASVGLTRAQAEASGAVEAVSFPLAGNGKALIGHAPGDRETGMVTMLRRPGGEIIGVHVVGDHVAELIAEGALLVGWQATPDDLTEIIHPHPTLSEALGEAAMALGGRGLHIHA
ncbi:dihydrolipoyl dehydrogenase [Tessaracoccus caeni]|uniref:dihydrolipoyl dehydrogenase n=1 Tax=Tessaracoccus caeni TaxID=3031239 RepID=UPI0023D9D147|nr:dihydrolipoyl dehydrogenase [Tessaracoccus caeni]MDF1486870.1 dihydrolipoyl dehydrogenase [Tessaracoccus caeni]